MRKSKPDGTVSHQIYLPEDADRKLKTIAKYGTWDDAIVECAVEGIEARWRAHIERAHATIHDAPKMDPEPKKVPKSSSHGARRA
jgi:hypothetical protein